MSELLKALVVEDYEDDALLVIRELRRGGFNVEWERIQTASEMQHALREKIWDVVISDYNLPQFSAPVALETLKHSGHDIPFIVVSGEIGEELAVETMKAGAHDYLMKGNLSRLSEAVRREIREARLRIEHKHAENTLKENDIPIGNENSRSVYVVPEARPANTYTASLKKRVKPKASQPVF